MSASRKVQQSRHASPVALAVSPDRSHNSRSIALPSWIVWVTTLARTPQAYDMAVFRELYCFDLGRERIPDATTLVKFRHLREESDFGKGVFACVRPCCRPMGAGFRRPPASVPVAVLHANSTRTPPPAMQLHSGSVTHQHHLCVLVRVWPLDSVFDLAFSVLIEYAYATCSLRGLRGC